ncbi:hypothetical protein Y032_0026g1362 [Ancylostoma ceylanicum]|uniref:Uncharacterized protein n=1 Tax=Ancylostoma ceylanicum TaxID=53326 RepID=A0A016UUA5_9BILA|nr:hypothetical protein Y032_0026g1362 [Ancylostoma ceylanicum]
MRTKSNKQMISVRCMLKSVVTLIVKSGKPLKNHEDAHSRFYPRIRSGGATLHLEDLLHSKIMEAREIKRYQPENNNKEELVEVLKLIA